MFELKLTEAQVNIVIGALGEMPAKYSHDVLNTIEAQIVEQSKPKEESESK